MCLCTTRSVWSKTSLISGGVGGAGAAPPTGYRTQIRTLIMSVFLKKAIQISNTKIGCSRSTFFKSIDYHSNWGSFIIWDSGFRCGTLYFTRRHIFLCTWQLVRQFSEINFFCEWNGIKLKVLNHYLFYENGNFLKKYMVPLFFLDIRKNVLI